MHVSAIVHYLFTVPFILVLHVFKCISKRVSSEITNEDCMCMLVYRTLVCVSGCNAENIFSRNSVGLLNKICTTSSITLLLSPSNSASS